MNIPSGNAMPSDFCQVEGTAAPLSDAAAAPLSDAAAAPLSDAAAALLSDAAAALLSDAAAALLSDAAAALLSDAAAALLTDAAAAPLTETAATPLTETNASPPTEATAAPVNFPNQFLRGISSPDLIDPEGIPSASVFYIEFENPERTDDNKEESINWRDSEESFAVLFSQRRTKDNAIQFRGGAAVLNLEEINRIRRLPLVRDRLSYERSVVPGNPFHGNLLLQRAVAKQAMQKLAATIALATLEIIKNPNV